MKDEYGILAELGLMVSDYRNESFTMPKIVPVVYKQSIKDKFQIIRRVGFVKTIKLWIFERKSFGLVILKNGKKINCDCFQRL